MLQREYRLTKVTWTRRRRICEINPDIEDLMLCILFGSLRRNLVVCWWCQAASSRLTMLFYWIILVHVPCRIQSLLESRIPFWFILRNIFILLYKPCHKTTWLLKFLSFSIGAWGGVVVELLRHLSDGPAIVSRWWHWIFQWHISFRPLQVSGIDSAPVENDCQEYSWSLGSRCVRLNISPASCPEYHENSGV